MRYYIVNISMSFRKKGFNKLNPRIYLTISYSLNSLQATGERSFFFTNYAYFSQLSSFSPLERLLMLRTAHVAHFEADHVTVESSGHFLANGIRASADNK